MADNVIPFPGGRRFDFELRQPEPYAASPEPSSYTLRIDLVDADPPIWREVRLRSDLTLDRVHTVMQRVLGWQDSHLHRFVMGPGALDRQVAGFVTEYDEEEGDAGIPEGSMRLDQVLRTPGDLLHYEYDFGDGWDHTIRLEEVAPESESASAAACLAGERACPPEDVGGIGHYNEIAAWLAAPSSDALRDDPHLAETVEWLPVNFDPAAFDSGETNRILKISLGQPPPAVPNEAYQDLARHFDEHGRRYLGELATLADLRAAPPDDDGVAAAMRSYLALLGLVGVDGVQLTGAGYLRPAEVETLFTELGFRSPPGTGTREASTPQIRQLRESAQTLGLVRRHKGRLVLTPPGRATVGDAAALWSYVAGRMPLGKQPFERHAGAIALLCAASGSDSRLVFDQYAGGLLELAGWTLGGENLGYAAFEWARPTWHVLWAVGREHERPLDATSPHATHLARAALLSPHPDLEGSPVTPVRLPRNRAPSGGPRRR